MPTAWLSLSLTLLFCATLSPSPATTQQAEGGARNLPSNFQTIHSSSSQGGDKPSSKQGGLYTAPRFLSNIPSTDSDLP